MAVTPPISPLVDDPGGRPSNLVSRPATPPRPITRREGPGYPWAHHSAQESPPAAGALSPLNLRIGSPPFTYFEPNLVSRPATPTDLSSDLSTPPPDPISPWQGPGQPWAYRQVQGSPLSPDTLSPLSQFNPGWYQSPTSHRTRVSPARTYSEPNLLSRPATPLNPLSQFNPSWHQPPTSHSPWVSSLNILIEGLDLAENISSITLVKDVFSTARVILTMIRVSSSTF